MQRDPLVRDHLNYHDWKRAGKIRGIGLASYIEVCGGVGPETASLSLDEDGGITVLILFAIMLTQSKAAPTRLVFQTQAIPAAVAAVILEIILAITVTATDWGAVTARRAPKPPSPF